MADIFIIHGRDLRVVRELQSFLQNLGLSVLTSEHLAARRKGLVSINQIVDEGIHQANIVLALLTPDECVALFDPETNDLVNDQIGWQARPNVFFELGIAYANSRERTILATLGRVRPFSDIDGIYRIPLENQNSKRQLSDKISSLLETTLTPDPKLTQGSFQHLVRSRWDYFDELSILENRLKKTFCGTARIELLNIIKQTISGNLTENWAAGGKFETTAEKFTIAMQRAFPRKQGLVEDAYWWM